MADPNNKWTRLAAPPAPMFFGKKERDLVKQINDELAERVIGQAIAYYPISIEESDFSVLYGESINKVSLPPVRVYAYVVVDNIQVNERYGYEYESKLTVNFNRKRLVEDQNLFVRVGDFIQYDDKFYEIVRTYNDTRYYFGQVEHKFQVTAECVRAREGNFRVMPEITRPVDTTVLPDGSAAPAPRPAPYPPLDGTYITVRADTKLPNERVLTAGSNIVLTDGGASSTLTIATTSQLTASDMRVTGDLTVVGTVVGGSPLKIAGGVEVVNPAGVVIAALGSSSAGADVLSASLAVVADLTASNFVSASFYYGDGSSLAGIPNIGGIPLNNQLSVWTDSDTVKGEANLVFDGTSFTIVGDVSASANISASSFYGDGSNLTNLPAAAISSYINPANNRVITSVSAVGVTGEANLTFDGALLAVTGDVTASANISASAFYGDGSNLSGVTSGPAGSNTQVQYNDGGSLAGSSNLTFDGTSLTIAGDVTASVNISASAFYGDGSNLSGVSATPGGATAEIQYNSSNAFAGSSNLTFNGTTLTGSFTGSVAEFSVLSASSLSLTGRSVFSGGLVHKRTPVSMSYTASAADYILGVTETPTSILFNSELFVTGQVILIKDESGAASSAVPITLNGSEAQTIDGAGSATIESPYGAVYLYSDGTNWFIY